MRYSQLFGKTQKVTKQFDSINATYLIKGGFIDQTMSGVYTFLPLGLRVLNKIENIVRKEINTLAQELFLPAISPKQLWDTTGRRSSVNILFKALGANAESLKNNSGEYILNSTHEEIITPLAKKFHFSYKDLPFGVYQIQTKFRNEPRAKSGLLRCREFRMKDLYSFHKNEKELEDFYEKVKQAYINIFSKIGLGKDTVIALASGGDFTDKYSHEFQVRCDTGEDLIFHAKNTDVYYNREVAPTSAPPLREDSAKILPLEKIREKGIIGVQELARFLKIPVEKTTKTILFETDQKQMIAAAVQGNYEISVIKLKKIAGCQTLRLASSEMVKNITGADTGYAGIVNLPSSVRVYMDESLQDKKNFECGSNITHYHLINVNFGRDVGLPDRFYDIKIAQEGDLHPETSEPYEVFRASEIGNIFPLNTKFTNAFSYTFTSEQGKPMPVYMGSYGIGTSRIMGVVVEKFHDEKGILWPESIAPYEVELIVLGDTKTLKYAEKCYKNLQNHGIEVLYDDRISTSPGEKFADADLIGIPIRAIVSHKTGSTIEVKYRSEKTHTLMSATNLIQTIKKKKN